ncbi:hypothetical protein Vretimale_20044, partial [Volvox reticuliferus]
LKPGEMIRLCNGLMAFCGVGSVRSAKKARTNSSRQRASIHVTERILEEFKDDFMEESVFSSIEDLDARLQKIVEHFGLNRLAPMVGFNKHDKVTSERVLERLKKTAYGKWRNTRNAIKDKMAADDGGDGNGEEGKVEEKLPANKNGHPTHKPLVHAGGDEGPGPSAGCGGNQVPEASEAAAAASLGPQGRWELLLDGNSMEQERYTSSGGHQSYLQGYNLAGKSAGCFLVGTLKEQEKKPMVLGAGLLLGNLVSCCLIFIFTF